MEMTLEDKVGFDWTLPIFGRSWAQQKAYWYINNIIVNIQFLSCLDKMSRSK